MINDAGKYEVKKQLSRRAEDVLLAALSGPNRDRARRGISTAWNNYGGLGNRKL